MSTLLRMDLRRMRSIGLLVLLPLLGFGGMALALAGVVLFSRSPDAAALQTAASLVGSSVSSDAGEISGRLAGASLYDLLSSMVFGGCYQLLLAGLGAGLFCVADFSSGYIKNLAAGRQARRRYLLARAMSLTLLMALIAAGMVFLPLPLGRLLGIARLGGSAAAWGLLWLKLWAVCTAFAQFSLLLAVAVQRESALVILVFAFGTGLVTSGLQVVWPPAGRYMLDGLLAVASFQPQCGGLVLMTCLLWAAGSLGLTAALLGRRDIC